MPPFDFDDFSAQASMLGYLYQVRYALWMALRVDDADAASTGITLERTDDVALTKDEQALEAFQTKYHLDPGRLTDSSADLWKTLRVWSEAILAGKVAAPGTLLTLVTTQTAPPGSAAVLLRPRQEERNEVRALELLRDVASNSKNKELSPAFLAFRSLSDRQQLELVRAIRILDQAPMIDGLEEKIEKELRWVAARPHIPAARLALEGWWAQQVYFHLQAPGSHVIQISEVTARVHDLRQSFNERSLPLYDVETPLDRFFTTGERHVFLKQLRLIEIKERGLVNAVKDFFRATELRGRWVREELLFAPELQKYDELLEREWDRHYDEAFDTEDADSLEETVKATRARQLLRRVEGLSLHIRPGCTDPCVMRGSFHLLADHGKVGWHPDFLERLKAEIAARNGA